MARIDGHADAVLPNLYAGTYVDNDHIGPYNVHVTGGTLIDPGLPGGGFQLDTSTGEGDVAQLIGPLAFELDEGSPIVLEVDIRVSVNASTAAALFVGFTDQNAAAEIPIEDEDGTLNTPATDAVGFMLEEEQDATWQAVSVNTNTDGAQTALTDATDAVLLAWQHLEIRLYSTTDDGAVAEFYIDGKLLSHKRTTAVSTSVSLAPVISVDGRAAVVSVEVKNLRAHGGVAPREPVGS